MATYAELMALREKALKKNPPDLNLAEDLLNCAQELRWREAQQAVEDAKKDSASSD